MKKKRSHIKTGKTNASSNSEVIISGGDIYATTARSRQCSSNSKRPSSNARIETGDVTADNNSRVLIGGGNISIGVERQCTRKFSPEDNNNSAKKSTKFKGESFPTPPDTKWGEIKIKFVDGHKVFIDAKGVRHTYNFTQMGMFNSKNSEPTKQWTLLRDFAEYKGFLTWQDGPADHKNQKRKELLAQQLQNFFNIKDNPFELFTDNRGHKGWKTRFQIMEE